MLGHIYYFACFECVRYELYLVLSMLSQWAKYVNEWNNPHMGIKYLSPGAREKREPIIYLTRSPEKHI